MMNFTTSVITQMTVSRNRWLEIKSCMIQELFRQMNQFKLFVSIVINVFPKTSGFICILLIIGMLMKIWKLLQEIKQAKKKLDKVKPILRTRCVPQKNAALMNENCCICLDAQEYTEKVIFNCTHSCCVNCTAGLLAKTFQNGIQTQAVCPMCRASIKTIVLPYTVSRVKNTPKNSKASVMNSKQANLLKPFCK